MGVWQQLENEFWGRVPTPRKYGENVLFSFGRICQTRQVGMDDMREGMRKSQFSMQHKPTALYCRRTLGDAPRGCFRCPLPTKS